MPKHTPGPWRVAGKRTGYIHGPDVQVCIVGNYRDTELLPFNKERWDADARLIAAAPDLLAALKDTLRLLTQAAGEDFNGVENARAAIAKATSQNI